MQFSIFKNQLSYWQGKSLIFGIHNDDINNQLKKIDFIVDPKQLTNKLKNNNFKGEIGNSITLDILGHKIDYLIIIGLGDKNKFNSDVLRNTLSDCIRKVTDKEEKIGLLLPWDTFDLSLIHI